MPRLLQDKTPATYCEAVAAMIRARRIKTKVSVAEAAARAGWPPPTWYAIEEGRSLTIDRLPAIAAALGCKPKSLLP